MLVRLPKRCEGLVGAELKPGNGQDVKYARKNMQGFTCQEPEDSSANRSVFSALFIYAGARREGVRDIDGASKASLKPIWMESVGGPADPT